MVSHSARKKLSKMEVQSSSSFKVRALLQQLRSHILQVLGTPDFRNSEVGHEVRKEVELLMGLYKQMVLGMDKPAGKAVSEHRWAKPGSLPSKEDQERKRQKLIQPVLLGQKEVGPGPSKTRLSSDMKKPQPPPTARSSWLEGSYVVGGSVSGWNFITFGGTKPVYYGVTKESFRSSRSLHVGIMQR